jgi:hypothetical protein
MKAMRHIYSAMTLIVFALLFIASAVQNKFYQVYKTVPENAKLTENNITFEDENCKVVYNLWKDGGDIGFSIYNKTENDIVVNIDSSFFVLNGVAYDYYQNRIITKTSNVGSILTYNTYPYWYLNTTRVAGSTSSSFATAYTESSSLIIPAKTSKSLSEYRVVNDFYSSCDIFKYPSKKEVKSLTFDKSNSPYIFYNLISYLSNGVTKRMENKFYVSEITNFPESEIVNTVNSTKCGKKSFNTVKVFKDISPNMFYIQYEKKNDKDEH